MSHHEEMKVLGAQASWQEEMPDKGIGNVRLSPIEMRNFALINDPALEGLHREDVSETTSAGASKETFSLCKTEDPALLARVVTDVLEVGPEIERIQAGQEGPLATDSVSVHPDNPYFKSDGRAIYSKDGMHLVCMVVPCEEYEVISGCQYIDDRAFDDARTLKRVILPDGLISIGRLAFAKSGVEFVDIPDSVERIEEKAFLGCKHLKACILGSALKVLGEGAFELSGIERISIPGSVEEVGFGFIDKTPAMRNAHVGSVSVAKKNPYYTIDSHGGLYKDDDLTMILSCVSQYVVKAGCKEILPNACRRNMNLREVLLPESLTVIGDDAFRGCRLLSQMVLPESLRHIGARAFMDTSVSTLRISSNVEHIGEGALLVGGENPVRPHRPLQAIDLDPRNERFYIDNGLLCERDAGDGNADKVLIYVGSKESVRIPDAVNRIAPYAFLGASDVEELYVHGHMHSICAGAFSVARSIPSVSVEISDPHVDRGGLPGDQHEGRCADRHETSDGKRIVKVLIPSLSSRYRNFSDLFTTEAGETIFVFSYYDAWVTNTKDIGEFSTAALSRLRDPIRMRDDMKELYLGILDRKQRAVCEYFAHIGELDALEDLHRWGVLDAATVIDVLGEAQVNCDTQAVGCLLEAKRRFGCSEGLDLSI